MSVELMMVDVKCPYCEKQYSEQHESLHHNEVAYTMITCSGCTGVYVLKSECSITHSTKKVDGEAFKNEKLEQVDALD